MTVPGRQAFHIRDGSRRISTGETDRSKATAVLMKYISERGASTTKDVAGATIGTIIAAWRRHIERKNPDTYRKKWMYVASTIERHAGHLPLSSVDEEWSERYADNRFDEGVERASIRQELQVVLSAWSLAKVSEPVPTLSLPAPSDPRQIWLTKDEARALIDACKLPHIRLFVQICLATGSRPGAILDLKWHKIHFDRRFIDLTAVHVDDRERKKPAARHVPISDDLIEMLTEARKGAQTEHVIEYAAAPVASIRKAFATAVAQAGLNPEVTPHILRHSAATWMAQAGVNLWTIAGFLGHKDIKMVQLVYGHHCPGYLRDAAEAVKI